MRSLTTFLALPVAATLVMGPTASTVFSSVSPPAAHALQLGNCYNTVSKESGGDKPVGEVTVVDCAKTHTYEVVAQTTFGEDVKGLPNEDSIKSLGEGFCQGEDFTAYVGVEAGKSSYQIEYLSPSADTWAKGDRKISCVVSQGNKSEVKGSAKGSKK